MATAPRRTNSFKTILSQARNGYARRISPELFMRERLFRFKQFAVAHEAAAMKVGTDGVTLGAIAPVSGRVLDVGCGCGLIGMMTAQRGASEVVMIEIDPAAAAEASANAAASPWADRINVVQGDFLTSAIDGTFDSIISNPPFFTGGLLAPDSRRAAARHEDGLQPEAFMRRAATLLAPAGTVCVIIPTGRSSDWTFAGEMCGLRLAELCELTTSPDATPKRTLLTFSRSATSTVRRSLALDSEEYKSLTSPFYL